MCLPDMQQTSTKLSAFSTLCSNSPGNTYIFARLQLQKFLFTLSEVSIFEADILGEKCQANVKIVRILKAKIFVDTLENQSSHFISTDMTIQMYSSHNKEITINVQIK